MAHHAVPRLSVRHRAGHRSGHPAGLGDRWCHMDVRRDWGARTGKTVCRRRLPAPSVRRVRACPPVAGAVDAGHRENLPADPIRRNASDARPARHRRGADAGNSCAACRRPHRHRQDVHAAAGHPQDARNLPQNGAAVPCAVHRSDGARHAVRRSLPWVCQPGVHPAPSRHWPNGHVEARPLLPLRRAHPWGLPHRAACGRPHAVHEPDVRRGRRVHRARLQAVRCDRSSGATGLLRAFRPWTCAGHGFSPPAHSISIRRNGAPDDRQPAAVPLRPSPHRWKRH